MNILEFADVIGKNILITFHSNQGTRFSTHFEHGEHKDSGCLVTAWGNGETAVEALNDYVKNIAGKTLVFNAMTDSRSEFNCPMLEPLE